MAGATVLIVEDDDALRDFFRRTLSLAGYEVEGVATGFKALRRLDTIKPDLIVLDLNLPGFDGISVLDELAAHAQHSQHPSCRPSTGSDVRGLDLNVRCVLQKPVSIARLINTVRECLASGAPPAGA